MNFIQLIGAIACSACLTQVFAHEVVSPISMNSSSKNVWLMTASIGCTEYRNMYHGDGLTALERLSIGRDVIVNNHLKWGLEAGVQSGNSTRLSVDANTLRDLGGLPIQLTIKPLLDFLVTVKTKPHGPASLFSLLKGGIAYRHLQFNDSDSIGDKSQIAAEVQAGIGSKLSEQFSLSLLYQGVFGASPDFQANLVSRSGHIENIPIQNGLLLSLSITG